MKTNIADKVDNIDDILITPSGNPTGRLRELSKLDQNTLKFSFYTPKELRPERVESSIHGGWEGTEIDVIADNINDTYFIDAKVIADNHRTGWVNKIDQFSVAELIEHAMDDEDIWQDQWISDGLSDVLEKVRYSLRIWLEEHQEVIEE